MIVIYDGSFEGFLTLVYEVYYQKLKPKKIVKELPNSLILDDIRVIESDEIKSLKVLEGLKKRFAQKNFEVIFHIFMCDSVEFELDLLHFIILGFKSQKELENINYPFVFNIQNLQKELFRYSHKMSGFIRFMELDDGTLYGKIETKFNIVYHLGTHFSERFNNQNYIIHDIKRKLAFVKIGNTHQVQEVATFDKPTMSVNEEKFSNLWKTFFASVAIQSRENKKLQKQMVPLIYRTFMTEFKED
ncbi:MAG: TIGR03915 family putative DNA repair protein [Arcobacteraceae bacterium]|jgi:probable DNA metabolism protein|nr:TIGR03915 family putative DNA repair protein [Arcobacteraceae bacterium]